VSVIKMHRLSMKSSRKKPAGPAPAEPPPGSLHPVVPERFDRDYESSLLDLCASGDVDPAAWRAHGPAFFMGGLATLLAGADGFDRPRYLRLAESLHAGSTTQEVFALWLEKSPVRPSRFLPMLRARLSQLPPSKNLSGAAPGSTARRSRRS